jgi:hypothetical protein
MKKILTLSLSLLFAVHSFAQEWIKIRSEVPVAAKQELVSSKETSILLNYEIYGLIKNSVETPRGEAIRVMVPGMVSLFEAGSPDIPKFTTSVIIPDMARMQVRILKSDFIDFDNIDIAPSKGHLTRDIDPELVAYTYGEIYNHNSFFPDHIAELDEPYILRDFRGQTLTVYPFQYNPITRTLRIFHELEIELYQEGTGGENQLIRNGLSTHTDREFVNLYDDHFVNFCKQQYPILPEEGNMLIISYGMFMEAMQPFIEWKTIIGRPVEIFDVANIGSTPDEIKEFIVEYYHTYGLSFLLLVGDHQHIPCKNMDPYSYEFSDNFYSYIVGDDSYNDIFIGRFSAETVAHVETQVEKVLFYERDLNEFNYWLDNGIGIARNEGSGNGHYGESDHEHIDFIRDSLLNFTYGNVFREYDGNVPGIPNTDATLISQRINDGAGIINYCNHGYKHGWSVGWFNSWHVDQLSNAGKLPYIWSVACLTGSFMIESCFAENWMRATNNDTGEPTGAVAAYMSTTIQTWAPPMTAQDEMVKILIGSYENNCQRSFGAISASGSMHMMSLHGLQGKRDHNAWIVFGDPTLTLRTKNPSLMEVSYPGEIYIGVNEITVNADCENAIASLTMNDEIIGTTYVNDGQAVIYFEPVADTGIMTLSVRAANKVTYMGQINVIPSYGPYVVLNSTVLNDVSGGNGNLLPDYGELIDLGIELLNIGNEMASDVEVLLSSTSPYVSVIASHCQAGDLLPGQPVTLSDAFSFEIAEFVPDQTVLKFLLNISGTEGNWSANFELNACAPRLSASSVYLVDDSLGGNNNGQAEPGELINLSIQTRNIGSSHAENITAVLTATNPYITIHNESFVISELEAGQSTYAVFPVSIDESVPFGTPVFFEYHAETGAYEVHKTIVVMVGILCEDFESGDFASFDWESGGNHPWYITDIEPYGGVYCARSETIYNNQTSVLSIKREVGVPDSISFFLKVSSGTLANTLQFYIDGELKGQWAREVPWNRVSFAVDKGIKEFKWVYQRKASSHSTENCAWIDNIVFPVPFTCISPIELDVIERSNNSALVSWSNGGYENEWDIIYGPAGFEPDNAGVQIEGIYEPGYEISGLQPSTSYDFYVRAFCGLEGYSDWAGPKNFYTLCEVIPLAFAEDFQNDSRYCWIWDHNNSNWAFGDHFQPPSSQSGMPGAYFAGSPQQLNYSQSLTSPLIDASNYEEVFISYILYLENTSDTGLEKLNLECKTAQAREWHVVETFSSTLPGSAGQEFIINNQPLPGVQGEVFQVRFRAYGSDSYNINGWGLDDVLIYADGLSAGITVLADNYETCEGNLVNFSTATVNAGINPGYKWFINGEEAGNHSPVFNHTPSAGDLISCELTSSIPGVINNPVLSEPVEILLFDLPNTSWSFMPYDTVCLNWGQFELTGGLPDGGFYSGPAVHEGFFCPATAGYGEHTLFYTFIDANGCSAIDSLAVYVDVCTYTSVPAFVNEVSIYPNPATDKVIISFADENEFVKEISIRDIFGQKVLQLSPEKSGSNIVLQVGHLLPGVYFIELITGKFKICSLRIDTMRLE